MNIPPVVLATMAIALVAVAWALASEVRLRVIIYWNSGLALAGPVSPDSAPILN